MIGRRSRECGQKRTGYAPLPIAGYSYSLLSPATIRATYVKIRAGPIRAEQSPVDEKLEHLPGEDFGQPRVVQTRQPSEDPGPVHSALGQQQMLAWGEVNPVPKVWTATTVWQDGQKPRVLQENVNRCSLWQSGQRIRAKPALGLPPVEISVHAPPDDRPEIAVFKS